MKIITLIAMCIVVSAPALAQQSRHQPVKHSPVKTHSPGKFSPRVSSDFVAFVTTRTPATLPPSTSDIFPVIQGGVTKNMSANVLLNQINTWTKGNAVTPVALTPGVGTIPVDASLSTGFTLTIGNNSNVLGNPLNVHPGEELDFQLTVGAGGFTGFSTGSNYKFLSGVAPTWSTVAGKIDYLHCKAWTTTLLECAAAIDVH